MQEVHKEVHKVQIQGHKEVQLQVHKEVQMQDLPLIEDAGRSTASSKKSSKRSSQVPPQELKQEEIEYIINYIFENYYLKGKLLPEILDILENLLPEDYKDLTEDQIKKLQSILIDNIRKFEELQEEEINNSEELDDTDTIGNLTGYQIKTLNRIWDNKISWKINRRWKTLKNLKNNLEY